MILVFLVLATQYLHPKDRSSWIKAEASQRSVRENRDRMDPTRGQESSFLFFFLLSVVLEIKLRASHILGKCSSTDHIPRPTVFTCLFFRQDLAIVQPGLELTL